MILSRPDDVPGPSKMMSESEIAKISKLFVPVNTRIGPALYGVRRRATVPGRSLGEC